MSKHAAAFTADDFRQIALGLACTVEASHMNHPDFRVNGRIFATIHADGRTGMVKLTPEQQEVFIEGSPRVFAPENGAWGRQGCTRVHFAAADDQIVGEALTLAWQNTLNAKKTARRKRPSR